jgi:hypothetical protein
MAGASRIRAALWRAIALAHALLTPLSLSLAIALGRIFYALPYRSARTLPGLRRRRKKAGEETAMAI